LAVLLWAVLWSHAAGSGQCAGRPEEACAAGAADEAERVSLLQTPRSQGPLGTCEVGDHVPCPGSGNMCAGDQCCPGIANSNHQTFPCPSATSGFAGCEQPKKEESCLSHNLTSGALPSVSGITGTHWDDKSDGGGCSMPQAKYTVKGAVALGQAPNMGSLSFHNRLCGHVVKVDCGGTPTVAVVASVCNYGDTSCGVDMITNTWNPATGNKPYGEVKCKMSLTSQNAISGPSNQCFYRPDALLRSALRSVSSSYTSVGLFNTGSKRVRSSTLAGVKGTFNGRSGYFDFDAMGKPLFKKTAKMVTTFTDGSTVTTTYSSCVKPSGPHIFG